MVRIIKGKPVLGRGGALVLLVILGGINRIASREQYQPLSQPVSYQHTIDSAIKLLNPGDLVLRRGKDITSYMVSQANPADKRFSHCGIVSIESGKPYVYHILPTPDSSRSFLRETAQSFFSASANIELGIARYKLSDTELIAQTSLLRQYYQAPHSFDHRFDLQTDSALYCSEFVYKLMNSVKQDSTFIRPILKNDIAYIPIENLYNQGKARLIWQMRIK